MEDNKKSLLAEARACERRGEISAAGEAYARAGAHEDAARVFLASGNFAEAGKALMQLAGYALAKSTPLDAAHKGVLLKAAICFSRAGDIAQAVQLFVASGEKRRAVDLLVSVGDMVNAARVEADRSGRIELHGYAKPARPVADNELEAARRLETAGKHEAAMEAYASLRQWERAARLARALGKVDRAAEYYTDANMPFEAAECYASIRDWDRALENLWMVTPAHPHYREACVKAIRACADRSRLTIELEHLVMHFQSTGPVTEAELEAFYALALLYETARSFENAALCYRKIVARRPKFRDTEDRLRACADEEHGASTKDFQRIVQEDQEFRDAVKRHATPVASQALRSGPTAPDSLPDFDPLPKLPSLPSLPSLPGLPKSALTPAMGTPVECAPIQEGLVINNRYRLEKKIGQGGMGAVYRARDLELDECIAIKFLNAGMIDEETIGRFKLEVSLSRQFGHPNVIRMYDLGSYGETKYMTMELLEGEDLGSLMKPGPLPFDQGIDLLIQACAALQIVHDHGVVHRDVKPDNFFLTKAGVLKVMDFGIAKRQQTSTGLTRANVTAGTPQYLAPEQASDFGGVTHLADIYALGCIAYKMFTGQVPFDSEDVMPILLAHVSQPPPPPRTLNPKIPQDLEAIILKLLAKRPEERVQSCRDLAALIEGQRGRQV